MTASRPRQNNFASGELDPLLHDREDFQRHQTGLAFCRGYLPLRQGAFTRAPGTIFRGTTHENKRCRRVSFQFAANDALTLEFTGLVMRVWRYGALVMDGASPYQLATPFKQNDLNRIQWVQDKDVIYMTDGQGPVQKITRLALDNWTIEDADFDTGPFKVQNLDTGITIQASAATGSITLTGVGNPFAADWVGSLIRLEPTDINIPRWVGNIAASVGYQIIFDSKIYELVAGSNTGLEAPTHEQGDVLTTGTTVWRFVSDLIGVVRVTAYTNANLVTATVIKTVPKPCIDDPTYRWAEGAWSNRQGWPACLEMADERLWAARTASEPRTTWASTLGAFEDFTPSVEADGSLAYTIAATQTQNSIEWLFRGRKGIFIGALGEVYRGFSNTTGQAIGPTTFDTEVISTDGAAEHKPITAHGYPIHVTRGGFALQELRYSFEEDGVRPVELSLPAQHLGGKGFGRLVWQSKPQRFAWAIMEDDGTLAVLSYDPQQEVLGWAVVPVAGGEVEDLDVTPGLQGGTDTLTLVVKRTIEGETVRYVEEQALIWGILTGGASIHTAVHLFASSVFDLETPQAEFTVAHLADEEVYAWTDAGQYGPLTVESDGTVTLPQAVSYAVIGLFDATHFVESLDLHAAARDGSSLGRVRRLQDKCGVSVYRTAAGRIAAVERHFQADEVQGTPVDIVRPNVADTLIEAHSGIAQVDLACGDADAVRLRYFPVGAAPMTVTGHTPNISEAGP